MIKIKSGIVFSDDIKRILSGVNAFDYKYKSVPGSSVIEAVRNDFRKDVNKIFDGNVKYIWHYKMQKAKYKFLLLTNTNITIWN